MWVLEVYRTAGVLLTFLRGPRLFSLARVGSVLGSEATLLPANRLTKKQAHESQPTITKTKDSKWHTGIKNAKLFILRIAVRLSHIYTMGVSIKCADSTLQTAQNSKLQP